MATGLEGFFALGAVTNHSRLQSTSPTRQPLCRQKRRVIKCDTIDSSGRRCLSNTPSICLCSTKFKFRSPHMLYHCLFFHRVATCRSKLLYPKSRIRDQGFLWKSTSLFTKPCISLHARALSRAVPNFSSRSNWRSRRRRYCSSHILDEQVGIPLAVRRRALAHDRHHRLTTAILDQTILVVYSA